MPKSGTKKTLISRLDNIIISLVLLGIIVLSPVRCPYRMSVLYFILLVVLVESVTKDLRRSIGISLGLILVLVLVRYLLDTFVLKRVVMENMENTVETTKDEEKVIAVSKEEDKKVADKSKLKLTDEKNLKFATNTLSESDIEKLVYSIQKGNAEKNNMDVEKKDENNMISRFFKDEGKIKKPITEMTPYEAQKETYQLVDTIKMLKETVDSLAPTLKQGKEVLATLQGMGLDN